MVSRGEVEADRPCNVPEMDLIVERAASMNAPVLQHTWLKAGGNEPGESTPYDLVELAHRHPEVQFVCIHTGGDWERGIRIIRTTKNVSAEITRSNPPAGFRAGAGTAGAASRRTDVSRTTGAPPRWRGLRASRASPELRPGAR